MYSDHVFGVDLQIAVLDAEQRTHRTVAFDDSLYTIAAPPWATKLRIMKMARFKAHPSSHLPIHGVLERISATSYEICCTTPIFHIATRPQAFFDAVGILTITMYNESALHLVLDHPTVLQAALAIAYEQGVNLTSYFFQAARLAASSNDAQSHTVQFDNKKTVTLLHSTLLNFFEHRCRLGSLSGPYMFNVGVMSPPRHGDKQGETAYERSVEFLRNWAADLDSPTAVAPLPKSVPKASFPVIWEELGKGAGHLFHLLSTIWTQWCGLRSVSHDRLALARYEHQSVLHLTITVIAEEYLKDEESTNFFTSVMSAVWAMSALPLARQKVRDSFVARTGGGGGGGMMTAAAGGSRTRANTMRVPQEVPPSEEREDDAQATTPQWLLDASSVHRQVFIVTKCQVAAKHFLFLCAFLFQRSPEDAERQMYHVLSQQHASSEASTAPDYPAAVAGVTNNPYSITLPVQWIREDMSPSVLERIKDGQRVGPPTESIVIDIKAKEVFRVRTDKRLQALPTTASGRTLSASSLATLGTSSGALSPHSPPPPPQSSFIATRIWLSGQAPPDASWFREFVPPSEAPPSHRHTRTATAVNQLALGTPVQFQEYTIFQCDSQHVQVEYKGRRLRDMVFRAFGAKPLPAEGSNAAALQKAKAAQIQRAGEYVKRPEHSFNAARKLLDEYERIHCMALNVALKEVAVGEEQEDAMNQNDLLDPEVEPTPGFSRNEDGYAKLVQQVKGVYKSLLLSR